MSAPHVRASRASARKQAGRDESRPYDIVRTKTGDCDRAEPVGAQFIAPATHPALPQSVTCHAARVIVQLKRRHAHAGIWHAPGETLNVTETVGRWLIAQGIAFEVPSKRSRKPPKQPQP